VFSDVIEPDAEMAAKIDEVRKPYESEINRVIGRTEACSIAVATSTVPGTT
jgi:sulfur-oxidizing protein SoxB